MTASPKPPSLSNKPKKSLSSRLWQVWVGTFVISVVGLCGLALAAWLFVGSFIGMIGFMPGLDIIVEAAVIMLEVACAIAFGVTLVVAIPAWIFQKPAASELKPEPAPQVSWVEAAKRDEPQQSVPDRYGDPAQSAFLPPFGLFWLIAAIVLAGLWLCNFDFLYQIWDVAKFVPHIALLCLVIGAAQGAWRFARYPALLPKTGWRLRLVMVVIAALWVAAAYQEPDREEPLCAGEAVEHLVNLQNQPGFERYLAGHPVCLATG